MELTELDLAEIIGRARLQDLFALGELHDYYYPRIYRYLEFRLFDEGLSQKFTAELFIQLLSSWNKLGKEPADLQTWLYNSAASLVDEANQESMRQAPDAEPRKLNAGPLPTSTDNEAAWLGALVRRVLIGLTPEQQHILALRFSAALSLAEIARMTGKGLTEVRTHQYSGLVALRQALEREAHAE